MEQVYQYLTGARFRQRVEAVIEKFDDMQKDLDRERKFMEKQWSKRAKQIDAVAGSTGMLGDLQGIAGQDIPEIGSLDMPLLDGPNIKETTTTDVVPQRSAAGDIEIEFRNLALKVAAQEKHEREVLQQSTDRFSAVLDQLEAELQSEIPKWREF